MSTQKDGGGYSPLFYYPGFDKKFPRRTFAGVVEGNVLYVAEAVCFPGIKPSISLVKKKGRYAIVIDPGMSPDNFNYVEGRKRALERASGVKELENGTKIQTRRDLIFESTLDLSQNIGKQFVSAVEEYTQTHGFPPKERKLRKSKGPKQQNHTPEPNEGKN